MAIVRQDDLSPEDELDQTYGQSLAKERNMVVFIRDCDVFYAEPPMESTTSAAPGDVTGHGHQ